MSDSQMICLRVEKISQYVLEQVYAHNLRLMDVPNADPNKREKNRRWTYSTGSKSTKQLVEERLREYPELRIQKNSVVANEVILTTSNEFFHNKSDSDLELWIQANLDWLKKRFGKNLLEVNYHADETSPHFHCIVTGLKEKVKTKRRTKAQIASNSPGIKYKVMSLCANEVFNRESLSKLQCEYANAMKPFGLKRGLKKSGSKHTTVKEYHAKTAELTKVKKQLKNTTESLEIKEKELLKKSEEIRVAKRKLAYIQQRAKDILEACFEPLRRAFEFASSNLNHQALRLISDSLKEYDNNKEEIKRLLPQERIQEVDGYVMPMRNSLK